jgi:hypothetical protein
MSISLYQIEAALQSLVDLREQAEAEGDSEALKVIDQQLREYLTKEAAKVTSYVALIRKREQDLYACLKEEQRIHYLRVAAQADIDRLKANALAAMQQFGVKELKATPGGGLRIQGNGGKEPLEIAEWPKDPGGRYEARSADVGAIFEVPVKLFAVPDTERIREALAQRVPCPLCQAKNWIEAQCPRCAGAGTIPNTVPGAKLLERGEHLRVL